MARKTRLMKGDPNHADSEWGLPKFSMMDFLADPMAMPEQIRIPPQKSRG